MTINFVSMANQDIANYSLPCKKTDLFVKLEEKLYKDFPKLKNKKPYFMVNAKKIERKKTIEENNITNNAVVGVFTIDK